MYCLDPRAKDFRNIAGGAHSEANGAGGKRIENDSQGNEPKVEQKQDRQRGYAPRHFDITGAERPNQFHRAQLAQRQQQSQHDRDSERHNGEFNGDPNRGIHLGAPVRPIVRIHGKKVS